MYFHSHISQLRDFSQETGVSFWNNILVFVPEVKHVAQQIDGCSLVLDAVEKADEAALLHAGMRNG